jgi:hypothetical protein
MRLQGGEQAGATEMERLLEGAHDPAMAHHDGEGNLRSTFSAA